MSFIEEIHPRLRFAVTRRLALFTFVGLSATVLCRPAFASDVTVASPVNGTHVTSPVWVRAHNVGCESVPPSAFGYSIDNSSTLVRGETAYDIDVTKQVIAAGAHIIHFKSWTARGACPVVNTQFIVGGTSALPPPTSSSSSYGIPANAVSSGDVDGKGPWGAIHDGGTPGSSRGSSVYPASTPLYDDARQFYMTYTDRGGERWNLPLASSKTATHFVLDTYVFLPSPSEVLNLEMDINQVMANGETVIFGTQCSGLTGTWEAAYTSGKLDHWWSSNIKCNPAHWTANTWHHVQVGMHRGTDGTVIHDWVNLDGAHYAWGYSRESAHFLGWAPGVVDVQYQIEGSSKSSGSVTSFIHKMTIYRW
ncbi:MAG TPA: hypothetical protein VE218_07375 [Acidobacteriaceae bacterium]|nr:hypothetical protein [Acidobacteriaceae bacterium]